MQKGLKQIVKVATAIQGCLKSEPGSDVLPVLPVYHWQVCIRLARRHEAARKRGWHRAAERLQRELLNRLRELQHELQTIEAKMRPTVDRSTSSIQDIALDLVALQSEFEDVESDLKAKTISVITEPIELEGLYLGPFRIELEWTDLADHPHNYSVIAVDPQPAASNDGVTHPHVQDRAVCEGDGRQPIRSALSEGRLFDFFTIVANLLRTYNSGSPYISISDWYGTPCSDCDCVVSEGDRYLCDRCDSNICGECVNNCPACDGVFCGECASLCQKCEERHCDSCLEYCAKCKQFLCPNCREQERCEENHDESENERVPEPIPIGAVLQTCQPGT